MSMETVLRRNRVRVVRFVWKKIAGDISVISIQSCRKDLEYSWMKGKRRGPSRWEEVVGEEKEDVQRVLPCTKWVLKTNFWEEEPYKCPFHVAPTFLSQVLGIKHLTDPREGKGRDLKRFKVWSEMILRIRAVLFVCFFKLCLERTEVYDRIRNRGHFLLSSKAHHL